MAKKTKTSARKSPTKKPAKSATKRASSKRKSATPSSKKKATSAKRSTATKRPVTLSKRTRKTTAATPKAAPKPRGGPSSRVERKAPTAASANGTTRAREPQKLSAADVEMFRELLLTKRAELAGDVDRMHNEALRRTRQDATGDLSSMPIHMADLGTDNYELELTLGLIEGERALLSEIDEALARVREGTYGFCVATGKPIGKARLKAKPWARYCYEYTLAQEKGQLPKG